MLDRDKYGYLASLGKDMAESIDIERDVRPLALKSIEYGCRAVLIKCGIKGMFYLTSGSEAISAIGSRLNLDINKWSNKSGLQKCYKADEVRSGTGAGDTSIAAFLAAVMKGYEPARCVSLACAEGACCVTSYDALGGLQTLDELEERIANGWDLMEDM